ncbi:MarR family winged helix-turn-helix transcriptional regulator [Methanobrevibacter sp.]|uniref:MarR family winged helix-turn-helix transcriptional regulator n=1 Tax=Methanobrevibacter sp. TaxID=66852 RepID=UPI003890513A
MAFDSDIPTSPLVSLLHRRQTAFLNDKLKDVNLSSGLYPLLIKTYKLEKVSQGELAEALHINESTVTRNLEKLEKKGLIQKTPEKRKKIISVTSDGAKIAKKIMDYDDEWDEKIKNAISNEDYNNFKNILTKICEDLI